MTASRIEARAVFKVAAILLLAIGVALLLEHVVVEVRRRSGGSSPRSSSRSP